MIEIQIALAASKKSAAYQKLFRNKLKEYGVNSPNELDEEDKADFFEEMDDEWEAENETD